MSSAAGAGAAAGCWCEACCNTNALIVKVSLPASFITEQTLIHRDTKQTDGTGGGCCLPPCHANSMDQSAESRQTRTQRPHVVPHSEITWRQQSWIIMTAWRTRGTVETQFCCVVLVCTYRILTVKWPACKMKCHSALPCMWLASAATDIKYWAVFSFSAIQYPCSITGLAPFR